MSLGDYKAAVRAKHRNEFELHHELARVLERNLISKARSHPDALALALDMLVTQAYKAHLSAAILGEHGHVEDMATIARRLLELAVQSIYIGGDSEETVRLERASQFIAYLWDSIPDIRKAKLPPTIIEDWNEMAAASGERKPGRKRWGPPFSQMFEYAGRRDTYEEDYRFLSALAHGSSDALVVAYSQSPIPVRSQDSVGVLLVYASKYYLNVVDHWIRLYDTSLYHRLENVAERLGSWSRPVV